MDSLADIQTVGLIEIVHGPPYTLKPVGLLLES